MKKVLSMVAALLLCVGTQAQIVSSRSAIVKTEKQASSTQWFLRAGLNIMNFSGDGAEGADSNIGYNATFGYQKPLGSTGGYWGMEFGLAPVVSKWTTRNVWLTTYNILRSHSDGNLL